MIHGTILNWRVFNRCEVTNTSSQMGLIHLILGLELAPEPG